MLRQMEYSSDMSNRLQEPTFLILTALLDQPRHGYALLTEVERLSAGRVSLRVGTLYAALDRLAGEGLVAVKSEEVVNGRLRRTYCLTSAGAGVVAAEATRMADLARTARRGLRRRAGIGVQPTAGGAR
jgi:DNA-binding PadR family transcriptional regulator